MSKKRAKTTKKLTVSELKAYIEGAVELNPEGWAPSPEQWNNIVEMIMNVKESVPVATVKAETVQSYDVSESYPQNTRQAPIALPSAMSPAPQQPVRPTAPPPQIDASQNPALKPYVEKTGANMVHDPSTGTVSSGLKFKTPTIDTSEKPYQSGYE